MIVQDLVAACGGAKVDCEIAADGPPMVVRDDQCDGVRWANEGRDRDALHFGLLRSSSSSFLTPSSLIKLAELPIFIENRQVAPIYTGSLAWLDLDRIVGRFNGLLV